MTEPPSPNTRRWVARRKAAVVAAVTNGVITIEEACHRYQMSEEEFFAWQRAFAPPPPTEPVPTRIANGGYGAFSPIRRVVSHRLQGAESRPIRRGQREGELRTLRAIRLRQRDQQGSTHIPTERSALSTDAFPRKVDRFFQHFAILLSKGRSVALR